MKFIQKILFVAIIGLFGTDAEGMLISPSGAHNVDIKPDEYLRIRVQKAQEVITKFNRYVQVWGDKQAFEQILFRVAINEVGYYVLNRICDTIKQIETNESEEEEDVRFLLRVKTDNKNQGFSPNPEGFSGKIIFAQNQIPTSVVYPALKTTVMEDTPTDVLLFHELLHFARFLINKDRFLYEGSQESSLNSLVITHEIFRDFPNLVDNFNREVMKAKIAIKKGILTAGPFVDDISLPWSTLTPHGRKFTNIPSMFVMSDENLNEISKKLSIPVIDVEEVRNIIGGGENSIEPIDKICENSYRVARNDMRGRINSLAIGFAGKIGIDAKYRASFSELFISTDLGLRYGHLVGEEPFPVFVGVFEWVRARAVSGFMEVRNAE